MFLSGSAQRQAVVRQRTSQCALPSAVPCARGARAARGDLIVRKAVEVPPSRSTASDELESLSRLSTVVPDTVAFESLKPGASLAAASVSASTMRSMLLGQSLGHKPYENAITAALSAGTADASSPLAAVSNPLDRAMVNVGAMLAEAVSGRVEVVVDPRLANDTAALVAKVRLLAAAYDKLRVPKDRLVFAIPSTWAGIRAVQTLEAAGIATTAYLVYGTAQGVAAMQAGASVIRVPVGRIHDWYEKNPGATMNPYGPRVGDDAASYDPSLDIVKDLFCYSRRYYPKTKIMAASLRSRKDVLELAGLDYLVLSGRLMEQLSQVPTDQGYNDGLSAVTGSSGVEAALTPQLAQDTNIPKPEDFTPESFLEALVPPASDLLAATLKMRARDTDELERLLKARISGNE